MASIHAVAAYLLADLERLNARHADPFSAMGAWMASAQKALEKSGFDRRSFLATAALESTSDDGAIRLALARGFEAIRASLAKVLQRAGMTAAVARACAALTASAYEGALIQRPTVDGLRRAARPPHRGGGHRCSATFLQKLCQLCGRVWLGHVGLG